MINLFLILLSALCLQNTWILFKEIHLSENPWDQAKKDIVAEQVFPCPSDHHVLIDLLQETDLDTP
ncbi:MAG: hypothetical protein AB8C84_03100 [Oligoflexales bacterium]